MRQNLAHVARLGSIRSRRRTAKAAEALIRIKLVMFFFSTFLRFELLILGISLSLSEFSLNLKALSISFARENEPAFSSLSPAK